MQVKFIPILFLLLFSALKMQGQHPYAWNLTVEDGLPSLEVYDLYQDSKGYIWVGTDKGLCKYNGNQFFYYQNKEELSEALSGIQEDQEGRIWVRNFKDQVFYVEDDSLHYFEIPHKIAIQDFLIDTKGSIWIIDKTKDSLYCYGESGHWKTWNISHPDSTLYINKGLFSIVEGGNNVIYLSSSAGIFKCEKDSIHFITSDNLARTYRDSRRIATPILFRDQEYTIFVLQSEKERTYQISQLLEDKVGIVWNSFRRDFYQTRNNSLRIDNDNTIWQLTLDGGLGPIFNSSHTSKLDSTLLLFPNEGISDFLIDREGNYWVSSLSSGVHIIPSLDIEHYNATNSIFEQDRVGVIERKNDDNLFISTDKGEVLAYNIKKNKLEHRVKIPKGKCRQLKWYQGNLIINGLGYHEIHQFLPQPKLVAKYKELKNIIRNTFLYKDEWAIYSFGMGVTMMSVTKNIGFKKFPSTFFPYIKNVESNLSGFKYFSKRFTEISSFYGISDEDNNQILIARDDSLMCYPEIGMPSSIVDNDGKAIRGIYLERSPKNTIWVCTVNSGIYELSSDLKVLQKLTIRDGLLSNKIKKLKIDRGQLWLLTAHGIQAFDPRTKESNVYTIEDGLPTHEIEDLAIIKDKIWLSTAKGLISFNKNLISKNTVPPSIYLKRIAIHDEDTLLASRYELNHQQNSLTIYVEGIAYRSRGNFKCQYRMLGIDSSWISQSSAINLMRFPQLNPGTYTFQVKAMNEDGVESSKTIDIQFIIHKPYWQIWWVQAIFYALIILLIITIVVARGRAKQRQEQQQNLMNVLRMRALQSQMNPHFIFNILTAVQNLWLQHKNELAMEMQSSFAKLLRKIFQYSSKKVISMSQVKDFLDNYLNLEQIRFENQVKIRFEIEEELFDGYFIPPLLMQPIIENSFKHGLFHKKKDKELNILIRKQENYIYCSIEDNGVGRPIENRTSKRSSGLKTTQKRLFILQNDTLKKVHPHNNLKITDLKSTNGTPIGTKVELWIPFVRTDQ